MRKIIISCLIFLMLAIPLTSAAELLPNNSELNKDTQTLNQAFTHKVLVEYGTMTTCPPCVTANAQLNSIYQAGDLDFNYVTLVWDRGNIRVRQRLSELKINNVPDVYFDGKYNHVIGGQSSEQIYRDAITQAGERTVPDIDISVNVNWIGGGVIKYSVVVNNNEPDPYNGYVRTYIVEKESRWNDNGGNPYHFAALDIPTNKSVNVVSKQVKPIGETYTFEKTWLGFLWGFGDIQKDNIIVIATVFDADTDYAVATGIGEPTTQSTTQVYPYILSRLLGHFPILNHIFNTYLIK